MDGSLFPEATTGRSNCGTPPAALFLGPIRADFDIEGHGVAMAPDGRFVTDGDPRAAFAIVRGAETLPMTTS
jgi:hypothetical protein